mmetsp:Transcript_24598/g.61117  ORF Transcript_24598/g.61117 Transcript_24598/m.61117 type:complete len:249 (+) Transcript_24598:121-867(+)
MLAFMLATALAAPVGLRRLADVDAVDLGSAAKFAVLSKAGISTVPPSAITGDIGVSPISAAAITGFSLIKHSDETYSEAWQVTGKVYASDYTSPTPSEMTTAISDMETAYTNAAGRTTSTETDEQKYADVKAGLIGGTTFTPGVYTWGTDILFDTDFTISGSPTDVFILQTTGSVKAGSGAKIILLGGALAKNIVWQVAGFVDAGTTSHLEGIFLVKTFASFKTGSTLNGQVFAQTAVTLDSTTIIKP